MLNNNNLLLSRTSSLSTALKVVASYCLNYRVKLKKEGALYIVTIERK